MPAARVRSRTERQRGLALKTFSFARTSVRFHGDAAGAGRRLCAAKADVRAGGIGANVLVTLPQNSMRTKAGDRIAVPTLYFQFPILIADELDKNERRLRVDRVGQARSANA